MKIYEYPDRLYHLTEENHKLRNRLRLLRDLSFAFLASFIVGMILTILFW